MSDHILDEVAYFAAYGTSVAEYVADAKKKLFFKFDVSDLSTIKGAHLRNIVVSLRNENIELVEKLVNENRRPQFFHSIGKEAAFQCCFMCMRLIPKIFLILFMF